MAGKTRGWTWSKGQVRRRTDGMDKPSEARERKAVARGHGGIGNPFLGVQHVAVICEDLERSMAFYCDVLELSVNPNRPSSKLPFRGAYLRIGPGQEMHLMELPNPDPATLERRPEHGGRDRHVCIAVSELHGIQKVLDERGWPYTASKSGRSAIFTRDPDANTLEFVLAEQVEE
eukprot:scaffold492_cov341-Pavlova_lutheri.AAC.4